MAKSQHVCSWSVNTKRVGSLSHNIASRVLELNGGIPVHRGVVPSHVNSTIDPVGSQVEVGAEGLPNTVDVGDGVEVQVDVNCGDAWRRRGLSVRAISEDWIHTEGEEEEEKRGDDEVCQREGGVEVKLKLKES